MTIEISKKENTLILEDTMLSNALKIKMDKSHGADISLYSMASDSLAELSLKSEELVKLAQYILEQQKGYYCPSCGAPMNYGRRKKENTLATEETHAWACCECPMILVEWYDKEDGEKLGSIDFEEFLDDEEADNTIYEGSRVNILLDKVEGKLPKIAEKALEKYGHENLIIWEVVEDDSDYGYKIKFPNELILLFNHDELELVK